MAYFSDRENGPRPRNESEISAQLWGGIIVLVQTRLTDGSFGFKFPGECSDGIISGANERMFSMAMAGEIPDIAWPLDHRNVPPTMPILDLLEFCHRTVGEPVKGRFHDWDGGHHHLTFTQPEGQAKFREDVDRLFARNGVAFELGEDGLITRLAPPILREELASSDFHTGDKVLDALFEESKKKFLSRDAEARHESLEKLWDAWERLKTLEQPENKQESISTLISKASPEPQFAEALNLEAVELTRIGNTFRIRHSEVKQVPLEMDHHVDYMFHRLFSLILMLLRTTGRSDT